MELGVDGGKGERKCQRHKELREHQIILYKPAQTLVDALKRDVWAANTAELICCIDLNCPTSCGSDLHLKLETSFLAAIR